MKNSTVKENIEYARQQISVYQAQIAFGTPEEAEQENWTESLAAWQAQLALALYEDGDLAGSIAAAERATPAWREQFLPRVKGISEAINKVDQTDCECLPMAEPHQKFSVETYGGFYILHCVNCNRFHARTFLPDSLGKIQETRRTLEGNTDIRRSIPDDRILD